MKFRSLIIATLSIMLVVLSASQSEFGSTLHAAPAPGGGPPPGVGPTCPPACPANPANCDASLVITPTQTLQFGAMAGTLGGTVTVDPAGARTSIGVILITGGTVAAASFNMTTTPYNCNGRALATVTVGPTATLNNISTPGMTMTVDTFVTNPATGGAFSDTTPLTVGATLHVNANQDPGSYEGTYDVTVTFQ